MHDIDSVPQHKRSIPKPPVGLTYRAGLLSQYRQHRKSQGNNKLLFYRLLSLTCHARCMHDDKIKYFYNFFYLHYHNSVSRQA